MILAHMDKQQVMNTTTTTTTLCSKKWRHNSKHYNYGISYQN